MDINVAICDDDLKIDGLKIENISLYKQITGANWKNNNIKTDTFFSGKTLVERMYKGIIYDVIFMDIDLKDEHLGTDIGTIIKTVNPNTLIIYMSSHNDYYQDIVMAEPFSFLNKPIDNERLNKVVSLIINRLNYIHNSYLYTFKSEGIVHNISLKDVKYLESKHRIIVVHMKDGSTLQFYNKLDDVELEIENICPYFVRISKSFYINLLFMISFSNNNVIIRNEESLSITHKYKSEAMKKIFKFVQ